MVLSVISIALGFLEFAVNTASIIGTAAGITAAFIEWSTGEVSLPEKYFLLEQPISEIMNGTMALQVCHVHLCRK